MYISCPNCHVNFIVSPQQITAVGRKVKCSKCGHIWHQIAKNLRLEDVIAIPITSVANQGSSRGGITVPTLRPQKTSKCCTFSIIATTGLIIFLSWFLLYSNLDILALLDVRHLALEEKVTTKDILVNNDKNSGTLTISYKVVNNSNHKVTIPLIRISMLDKNSKILKSSIVNNVNHSKLAPNEYISLKSEFTDVAPATEKIEITLGNRLDFILRQD